MKSKINYFMEKDTRLVLESLTKVIVNENIILINYTSLRKNFKDKKNTVVRYMKDKNRMIIYKNLKKYNFNFYKAFVEWAENNEIEWYGIGKEIIKKREEI